MKKLKYSALICAVLLSSVYAKDTHLSETLGKALFFDKNLSKNRTQSCATCHNPEFGFVDNRDNGVNAQASLGDDGKSLGNREAPTISYAMMSPTFHYDDKKKAYIGGQFWDGREATLSGQAGGPPLNPIEMGMSSKLEVVSRLQENDYYVKTFKKLFGENIFHDTQLAYEAMTKAIESFEQTDFFAPFDSKYDRYLKGEYDLTVLEDLGRTLFFSNNNNSCASCHVLKGEDKEHETFTNYEYRNIGTPSNKRLRAKNGIDIADKGLFENPQVNDEKESGKFKVPTLRNVAITAPYMHNGVFKDLRTVIEFYDKYNNKERTINPETNRSWDEPEIRDNIAIDDLKATKLSERKIDALVAFLKLLTDKRYEHLMKE